MAAVLWSKVRSPSDTSSNRTGSWSTASTCVSLESRWINGYAS